MGSAGDTLDNKNEGKTNMNELMLLEELRQAATVLSEAVHDLIGNSEGVAGLHQNGDIAPWDSLMAGGQFEEWLSQLDQLDAVLAKVELAKGDLIKTACNL